MEMKPLPVQLVPLPPVFSMWLNYEEKLYDCPGQQGIREVGPSSLGSVVTQPVGFTRFQAENNKTLLFFLFLGSLQCSWR